LQLVDQDVEGQCNSECKTIERACQEVVGFSDTDIAEYLYARRPQLKSLVNYLCKDLTGACSKKPPPVPKGLPGAPGMKMYSREELMNMKNFGNEDVDEDEDEIEDEEAQFKSNLGKAFKETTKNKADWKEKAMKQITDAGNTLKTHVNEVSHQIRKWWRSKTSAGSKKKSTGNKAEL
ncbi:Elongation factor Ts, partial [Bienertia sinuspersici]